MLLLERPKRAINPQIQRRARALSSLRKAWDVSAGRTNRTASPAEVASSAKLFCSSGYYTQILSICRPGCCSGLCRQPPRLPAAPPAPPGQPRPRCHPPKPRAPEAPARVAPSRGGWPRAARPLQARWGRGWIPGGGPQTSPSRSAALLQRGQTKEPGAPGAPAARSAPRHAAGAHHGANAGGTGKGAPSPRLASATELRAACGVLQPPQSLSRKENAPAFGDVLAVCSCPKAARARGASPWHAPGVTHRKPSPC